MQKSTSIYRSSDDVKNLKIRVKIYEAHDELPRNDEGEAKVFSWQQKVYGKFERDFYRDKKNCVTDLEKKYHEDVVKLVQSDSILFTYVNEDDFCLTEEKCVLNSKTTTELCKRIANMRLADDNSEFVLRETDGFNFKQSLISSLNNPYGGQRNYEVMHIMADLGDYVNNTWLKSEYILCTLKYDQAQKLLIVLPDFTLSQPYYIQVDDDTKRTFQYFIEDASEKMPTDVLLKENEILNKITLHQTRMRLQKTGTDFELPPKTKLNVHLFFDIQTAQNFEYNDIYVQYFVDLPKGWCCKNPPALKGTTQTAHSHHDNNLAYFGYPFEVCLEYNIQELKKNGVLKAPYVYFEVVSKDSWDRFRTEGLTYTILPISQPGVYKYDLQCLRICPDGVYGNLKRFFIGDYSSYSDVTWISVPHDYGMSAVNKYGSATVGTGQISVRISVVHQSQAFMADFRDGAPGKREKFLLEKLSTSSLVKSIEQVLGAFRAAKKKMIEARKSV